MKIFRRIALVKEEGRDEAFCGEVDKRTEKANVEMRVVRCNFGYVCATVNPV